MGVLELNRDKWKEFKNKHDFSKSSFFSKADVGPTIEKFQDAVARFKKTRAQKDLMSAFKKAQDLQKAFAKFIQLKEAKAEMNAEAKQKIEKWSGQLDDVTVTLAKIHDKYEDTLKENDAKQLNKQFDEMFPW